VPGCVLVAIESKPVVAALLRDLEPAGFAVEVVPPADAGGRADPARHEVALIRAAAGAEAAVAALRKADASLAVVVLFFDEEEAQRHPEAFGADGALVGPLGAQQVSSTCRLAARLTVARRRLAEPERAASRAASGAHDLTFLKRLLFVEVKRSRRYGIPISLALVSVDRWEELIAQLGPSARATVLGELTGVVAGAVRDIDISVPFSDERLVVLMPHTETGGGLQVARRVCARVRERSSTIPLTVSIGLASHDGHGTVSFGALVKRASEALERAREGGGDRAVSAEPPKRRDRISIG
jgi:diguanylate cyclase (GGDEF)-like protein